MTTIPLFPKGLGNFYGAGDLYTILMGRKIEELATVIRQGIGYAGRDDYSKADSVSEALRTLEERAEQKGAYAARAAEMCIALLGSIPDLQPQIPWQGWNDARSELYRNRGYVEELLSFVSSVASIRRDTALFDKLYSMVGSPQMNAECAGIPLIAHLFYTLRSAQTDRRLRSTWDDMLRMRSAPSRGSHYGVGLPSELCVPHIDGYFGMASMPPLEGEYDGPPIDILPYATDALVVGIRKATRTPRQPVPIDKPQSDREQYGLEGVKVATLLDMLRFLEQEHGPEAVRVACTNSESWPRWALAVDRHLAVKNYSPAQLEFKEMMASLTNGRSSAA